MLEEPQSGFMSSPSLQPDFVFCAENCVGAALLRAKEALMGLKPWAGGWVTGLPFKSAKAIDGSFLPTELGMLAGLQGHQHLRSLFLNHHQSDVPKPPVRTHSSQCFLFIS